LNANYANSTNFRKSHFYKYKYISNLYFVSICENLCYLRSFSFLDALFRDDLLLIEYVDYDEDI